MSKYILKSIDDHEIGSSQVTYEVNEIVHISELEEHLRNFLLACGWHPGTVKDLFGGEE